MKLSHEEYIIIQESLRETTINRKNDMDFAKVRKIQQLQERLSEAYKLSVETPTEVPAPPVVRSSTPVPQYSKCGEVYEDCD